MCVCFVSFSCFVVFIKKLTNTFILCVCVLGKFVEGEAVIIFQFLHTLELMLCLAVDDSIFDVWDDY